MRFALRRAVALVALLLFAATGIWACGSGTGQATGPEHAGGASPLASTQAVRPPLPAGVAQASDGPLADPDPPQPLAVKLENVDDPVVLAFKKPPKSGLMFDLDTGQVLWRLDPTLPLPIASLTKMMTSVLVAKNVPEGGKVRITRQAEAEGGQRVGVLPLGKRVGVSAMLNGLLIVSGNDTAVALAQRVSGTVPKFVSLMNATARKMNLGCTRFASPDGLNDAGRSCAYDLAAIERALLDQPRLAAIVKRPQAIMPGPVKGGKFYFYSHNPLIKAGYPGTIGVKTGFTDAAGECFVGAVERDGRRVGVILLNSSDPTRQSEQLLDRAWPVLGV